MGCRRQIEKYTRIFMLSIEAAVAAVVESNPILSIEWRRARRQRVEQMKFFRFGISFVSYPDVEILFNLRRGKLYHITRSVTRLQMDFNFPTQTIRENG